jgi:hypothetical protein
VLAGWAAAALLAAGPAPAPARCLNRILPSGQRDPAGRAYGHSFMTGDTWRLLNTAVYAFSQDATQQPQRYRPQPQQSST